MKVSQWKSLKQSEREWEERKWRQKYKKLFPIKDSYGMGGVYVCGNDAVEEKLII